MRFLLDANMPRSALALLMQHGHEAEHVKDIGLGNAPDGEIAAQAFADGAVLVTRDLDFADVRRYPPQRTPGFLVLRIPDDWTAKQIVALLGRFLSMESVGRFYIRPLGDTRSTAGALSATAWLRQFRRSTVCPTDRL
jgi:predicted nuclease of predicted toxin-antitoxin system